MNKVLIIFLSLIWIWLSNVSTVFSQTTLANKNYIMFFQNNSDGSTTVNVIDSNGIYSVTVLPSECYSFAIGEHVIGISQKQNPSSIRIIDLKTSETIGEIRWKPEWVSPCAFGILADNSIFVRPDSENQEAIVFNINAVRDIKTVDLTQGMFIAGRFQKSSDLEPIYENITNGAPFKVSPDTTANLILYYRCSAKFTRNEGCTGSSSFGIYDLSQNKEITTLQATPFMRRDPVFDFGYSFHWSPRGNYIAYRSDYDSPGERIIYDLKQNNYIDTSTIRSEAYRILDLTRWSPDETKIAMLLVPLDESKAFGTAVGVFDLSTQQFEILPGLFEVRGDEWDWLPTSDGFALTLEESRLLRVDLQGSSEVIAQNVDRISSTYNQ